MKKVHDLVLFEKDLLLAASVVPVPGNFRSGQVAVA
jgi:hypothetical protein